MKNQQIEFKEIDTDHLGSNKEYKIPKQPDASGGKSTPKADNSWQRQITTQ